MKEMAERVKDWFNGKERGPHTLKLKINSFRDCNLECVYCKRGFDEVDEDNNISHRENMELIEEAASLGTHCIDISGSGEPPMSKNFLDIIGEIKKGGMEGTLTTNGTLFEDNIVRRMVGIGWDEINISLDGPDAETQDKLRPAIDSRGNFNRVIETLEMFSKWKNGLDSEKPEINFVPVLNNENYNKMSEFIELARTYDVNQVSFKPLMTFGMDELEEYKIPSNRREELNQEIRRAQKLADSYNVDTNVRDFFSRECVEKSGDLADNLEENVSEGDDYSRTTCFQPWLIIQIFAEEKLATPCIASKKHGISIEETSLEDIWFSERFDELRSIMKSGEVPDFCEGCCGGNLLETRDLKSELRS